MHSHDRTLLARLGFDDPDKRNPLHDLAAQYLATKAPDIVRIVGIDKDELLEYDSCDRKPRGPADTLTLNMTLRHRHSVARHHFEHPIVKGEGQYATSIGFIDLLLFVDRSTTMVRGSIRRAVISATPPRYQWEGPQYEWGDAEEVAYSKDEPNMRQTQPIGIEVKIAPLAVGDILRQIALYATYRKAHWLLATAFQLREGDIACLANEHIHHVSLGSAFETFAAEANNRVAVGNTEL